MGLSFLQEILPSHPVITGSLCWWSWAGVVEKWQHAELLSAYSVSMQIRKWHPPWGQSQPCRHSAHCAEWEQGPTPPTPQADAPGQSLCTGSTEALGVIAARCVFHLAILPKPLTACLSTKSLPWPHSTYHLTLAETAFWVAPVLWAPLSIALGITQRIHREETITHLDVQVLLLLSVWPWVIDSVSLSLRALIYKTGRGTPLSGCCREQ